MYAKTLDQGDDDDKKGRLSRRIEELFDEIAEEIDSLIVENDLSRTDIARILYNAEYRLKEELLEIINDTR